MLAGGSSGFHSEERAHGMPGSALLRCTATRDARPDGRCEGCAPPRRAPAPAPGPDARGQATHGRRVEVFS